MSTDDQDTQYANYMRTKAKYVTRKRLLLGGSIITTPLVRNFTGDWSISGPISFYIYKRGEEVLYLFGDMHRSWSNTCSRPEAKPATSLLTFIANCNAKGNCITIMKFIERCGLIAHKNSRVIPVYYEDSHMNSIVRYSANREFTENLIKYKSNIDGPLMEVLVAASVCRKEENCDKGLRFEPVDLRHVSPVVSIMRYVKDSLNDLHKEGIKIRENSEQLIDTGLLTSFVTYIKILKSTIGEKPTWGDVILTEVLGELYRHYDDPRFANSFHKVAVIADDTGSKIDSILSVTNLVQYLSMAEEYISLYQEINQVPGATSNLGFINFMEKLTLLMDGYSKIEDIFSMSVIDVYTLFKLAHDPEKHKIVYLGHTHIMNYQEILPGWGFELLFSSGTIETVDPTLEIYERVRQKMDLVSRRSRCISLNTNFQKLINFDV